MPAYDMEITWTAKTHLGVAIQFIVDDKKDSYLYDNIQNSDLELQC